MRILVLSAAIAALAGCAAPAPPPPRPISQATDYQVCVAAIVGNPVPNGQEIVAAEQKRRGLDCAPYAQAVIADQAAQRQEALQILSTMPHPRQTTRCTSTSMGSTTSTSCY